MPSVLQISFDNFDDSEALRGIVEACAQDLERRCGELTRCDVKIHRSPRTRWHSIFEVRLRVGVHGGRQLVVDRAPGDAARHDDPVVAIRDAFRAAERQLRDESPRTEEGQR